MKKLLAAVLVLAMVLGYAVAEASNEKDLHLLFGIPFDSSESEVIAAAEALGLATEEVRRQEDSRLYNIATASDADIRISGIDARRIYFSDVGSEKFPGSAIHLDLNPEEAARDYAYGCASVALKSRMIAFPARGDKEDVFWLDNYALPGLMYDYMLVHSALTDAYGAPDVMYCKSGETYAPALRMSSLNDMSYARFWLDGLAAWKLDTSHLQTSVYVVWGNVVLQATLYLSNNERPSWVENDEPPMTEAFLSQTIFFYAQPQTFPELKLSTKVVNLSF